MTPSHRSPATTISYFLAPTLLINSNSEIACRCFEYVWTTRDAPCDARERPSLRAFWTRTLMRRQLPNKHCEPPNEVNTFRTSERKSKESADFGCQVTAHTRPLRSIVASHPSLDLADSHRLPLIKTNEQYRVRAAASRSCCAPAAPRAAALAMI